MPASLGSGPASGASSTSALWGSAATWLDTAWVRGEERLKGLPEDGATGTGVVGRLRAGPSVAGLDWEPCLYAGYARGSGNPAPETDSDRSFRQAGLEANEAGINVFLEIVPATGTSFDW